MPIATNVKRSSVVVTLLAVIGGSGIGCGSRSTPPTAASDPRRSGSVVTLYAQGHIATGDPAVPSAQAIATADGLVLAVGPFAAVEAAASAAANGQPITRESLDGRLVLPGFVDAHVHIESGGTMLAQLDLSGLETKAEILAAVGAYAKAHPDDAWIVGRGWSYGAFRPALPHRKDLDAVVGDRAVALDSYDGHTLWVSSKALELAGVTAPYAEGVVLEKGVPTGALLEDAGSLVGRVIPQASHADRLARLRAAFDHAASLGVTTLGEVGVPLADLDLYEELARTGGLPVRVVFGPRMADLDAYAVRVRNWNDPSGRLLPGPVKGFVDGVVESNTAAFLAPYADGTGAGAKAALNRDTLEQQMRAAGRLGVGVAYHAIGDAAVRSVLDATQAIPSAERPPRVRVEHIEVLDPADAPRFAELGVWASMMPYHASPGDEPNGGVWATKVGAQRLLYAFAMGTLHAARAPMAFGSDWPVMTMNPLPALAVAATRRGPDGKPPGGWIPEQAIPMQTAIVAYTAGAGQAMGLAQVGVLRPGAPADFVVLSKTAKLDVPHTFHAARVELTVAAGHVIYRAPR